MEDFSKTLVSDSSIGACLVDREGKIFLLNRMFASLFSRREDEIKGAFLSSLIEKESAEILASAEKEAHSLKGGFIPAFPVKAKVHGEGRARGFWFLLNEISTSVPGEKGGALGILAVDATREILANEERAKISGAIRENLKEIAHLGTWEYDVIQDRFTFNDAFYSIFKTTAEEVGGYEMSSQEYARRFVHPEDAPMVGQEVRRAIETDDPFLYRQVEHRIIYKNGSVGYITVRFFIVKDEKGRTVRTYGVNQDITEYKRAQEELKMANEFMVARAVKVSELERENAELKRRLGIE